MILLLLGCSREGPSPPADAREAFEAHPALLDEACGRFEAIGPFPLFQTIDTLERDGAITFSNREIMGAQLQIQEDPTPDPDLLGTLGATPEAFERLRELIEQLGAQRLHRWEPSIDADGAHPWIVLRSDTVFSWDDGPTLVCREGPLTQRPEPLVEVECDPVDAEGRWWRCQPELALTAL